MICWNKAQTKCGADDDIKKFSTLGLSEKKDVKNRTEIIFEVNSS